MATPATRAAPPKDAQVKVGMFPQLRIVFGLDRDFSEAIEIDANYKQTSKGAAARQNHTFSFILKAKRGDITVRENIDDRYQAAVTIVRSQFIIVQYDDLDSEGNPSETLTMHFALRQEQGDNAGFQVRLEGNRQKDRDFQHVATLNTIMGAKKGLLQKYKHVKIVVPGYKKVMLDAVFNIERARDILQGRTITDYRIKPELWYEVHMQALRAETQLTEQKHATMVRKNVTVSFAQMPGYVNRWYATLRQPDTAPQWMLQGQERITFTVPQGQESPIFSKPPTKIPGTHKADFWQGTVFFRHGVPCAILDNIVIPQMQAIFSRNEPMTGITIGFNDEEDPNWTRNRKALQHLLPALSKQLDPDFQPPGDRDVKLFYNIPPAGILMEGRRELIKRDVPAESFKSGHDPLNNPAYELARESHRTAINNVITSKSGVSLVQGPPATGKTELVAKIICIYLKHVNVPVGHNIVLAAHTNVAVSVAALRVLKLARTMFSIPANMLCLVWSQNKAEYGRLVQKDLPKDLADITLDAHLDRAAGVDRTRYASYFQGRKQIQDNGRIEDNRVRKEYLEQLWQLIKIVKSHVKVWFGTLASFHQSSQIFGLKNNNIECGLLIIDEASQAHGTAVWAPWNVLDPHRIVLAGDHKQLAPHCETTEARWAWQSSVFEQLNIARHPAIPSVMLDLQFRTTSNIYAATNVFYPARIDAGLNTRNRPLYQDLMKAVPRIHFVDNTKKEHKLSLNTHWFDMNNGRVTQSGETSSSTNRDERDFLALLFAALYICGITPAACMMLTGYQAMYDDLREIEKQFSVRGTIVKKVDSAQGDEAGIVGISLVRTVQKGLGFMSTDRRQNVMTSRARDGLFGVGQVEAMVRASKQNHPAWWKWFQRMKEANGAAWHIPFEHPVQFFVDGKPIKLNQRARVDPEETGVAGSTTEVIDKAIQSGAVHPPLLSPLLTSRARSSTVSSPPARISPAASPGLPPSMISLVGQTVGMASPRQLSPQMGGASLSRQISPQAPVVPSPQLSPQVTGSGMQQVGRTHSSQSSTSMPRRSSILNPQHGRTASGTLMQQQALVPFPSGVITEAITSRLRNLEGMNADDLKQKVQQYKVDLKTWGIHFDTVKTWVMHFFTSMKTGSQANVDETLDKARSNGVPVRAIEQAAVMAYAAALYCKLTGTSSIP